MGGRGSQGGTRSTYRGNSTALFKARQGQSTSSGKGGGGGGGGSSSGGGKGTGTSGTGGVQTGTGGGNGSSGGSSGGGMPPVPPPYPANLRQKEDKRRDTDERLANDIVAVNPRWREGNPDPNLNQQWDVNCTSCAEAVEMRARGYDVTAEPRPADITDNTFTGIVKRWLNEDGQQEDWQRFYGDKSEQMTGLKAEVNSWPEGARGFVAVIWNQGGAHIFNVEKREGRVWFIDGQTNQFDKGDTWIDNVDETMPLYLFRTDDKTLKDNPRKWIRERTSEEINAPLRAELNSELRRRGYALGSSAREAFTRGWDDIRSGRGEIATPYPGDPDLRDIYLAAVEWARRPD